MRWVEPEVTDGAVWLDYYVEEQDVPGGVKLIVLPISNKLNFV